MAALFGLLPQRLYVRRGINMKDIIVALSPIIRSYGFKGSGQNYRKFCEQVVLVLNFQKSSSGDRFYVNLGVQPLFIPTEGHRLPIKEIKEYECVFRKRITPPPEDLGWPMNTSKPLLNALGAKLQDSFDNYFTPLSTIPGPITEMSPMEYMSQDKCSLFGIHNARGCLHFSRIALARKEYAKAIEFARYGLDNCGPQARSLIGELNQVIDDANKYVTA